MVLPGWHDDRARDACQRSWVSGRPRRGFSPHGSTRACRRRLSTGLRPERQNSSSTPSRIRTGDLLRERRAVVNSPDGVEARWYKGLSADLSWPAASGIRPDSRRFGSVTGMDAHSDPLVGSRSPAGRAETTRLITRTESAITRIVCYCPTTRADYFRRSPPRRRQRPFVMGCVRRR